MNIKYALKLIDFFDHTCGYVKKKRKYLQEKREEEEHLNYEENRSVF